MGRILALDYGKRRTGIAVTDPLQIIANGLTTVETKQLMAFLTDYLARECVEQIVVGLPIQTDGSPSENQARVRSFTGQLKKMFPDIPVTFYDERYTSVIAQRVILDSGMKKKARRENKGLVDEISATIILQDFLQSMR